MSGHVFHPGHEALHGVTVVLETSGGHLYVGRYHDTESGKLRLHDVGMHDAAASGMPNEEYLRRTMKFGVRVEQKFVAVPEAEVTRMTPLGEVQL